jgi:hypothetical protein
MKGGFYLFNGQFHKENESVFSLADLNRSTEGWIEFFRAEHNEILFLKSICNHLVKNASNVGIDLWSLIDSEGRLLRKDVSRLLNKNKLYLAARIGIQVFPSEGKTSMLLWAEEMERGYYPINETGLILSFYDENTTGQTPSFFNGINGFCQMQIARRKAEEIKKPNMILLNQMGEAFGSIFGSFAYIVQDKVHFTSENSGGYRCAIQNEIIQSVTEAGFIPLEKDKITQEELLNAEELFLFDSCHGIQKVLGLEDQRYFSTKTRLIAEKLRSKAMLDRKNAG